METNIKMLFALLGIFESAENFFFCLNLDSRRVMISLIIISRDVLKFFFLTLLFRITDSTKLEKNQM